MSPMLQQIRDAYETAGLEPEDIQRELFPDLEIVVIKTALFQVSPLYKSRNKESIGSPGPRREGDNPNDVTDDEFEEIKVALKQLALSEDTDPVTRVRALRFLWDEKKGRNDEGARRLKELQAASKVDVFVLAEQLQQARKVLEMTRKPKQITIDIAPQERDERDEARAYEAR